MGLIHRFDRCFWHPPNNMLFDRELWLAPWTRFVWPFITSSVSLRFPGKCVRIMWALGAHGRGTVWWSVRELKIIEKVAAIIVNGLCKRIMRLTPIRDLIIRSSPYNSYSPTNVQVELIVYPVGRCCDSLQTYLHSTMTCPQLAPLFVYISLSEWEILAVLHLLLCLFNSWVGI